MNDKNSMQEEQKLLAQQFAALGKAKLPPALTSEALFARMDEAAGSTTDEQPQGRVLRVNWKRWGTVAAAVLVVVGVYAAERSGILQKNSTNSTTQEAALQAQDRGVLGDSYSYSEQYAAGASPEDSGKENDSSSTGNTPDSQQAGAGEVTSMLGGWDCEGECQESAAASSGLLTFSDENAAKVVALLARQQWNSTGAAVSGYTFSLSGKDYEYDSESGALYNYTDSLAAQLSSSDKATLTALCEASLS